MGRSRRAWLRRWFLRRKAVLRNRRHPLPKNATAVPSEVMSSPIYQVRSLRPSTLSLVGGLAILVGRKGVPRYRLVREWSAAADQVDPTLCLNRNRVRTTDWLSFCWGVPPVAVTLPFSWRASCVVEYSLLFGVCGKVGQHTALVLRKTRCALRWSQRRLE